MDLSSSELLVVRAAYIICELCFIFNLFFILHNIYKYIIGLKIKKTLILLFYILSLFGTFLRAIEFGVKIADPWHSFLPMSKLIFFTGSTALTFTISVEITLILTMH